MTGAFAFSLVATVAAAAVYSFGLRPDPLLTALAARTTDLSTRRRRGGLAIVRANPPARYAVVVIALSHATMVALMSMAPVHLRDHGATLSIVGLTISLHVAGMYALSPVFGWLADRVGRLPVILTGQAMLLTALGIAWRSDGGQAAMTVSLIFLGLGWSASVVAASALVAEAVDVHDRSSLQGFSDLSMNAAGALGGALAGPVLALAGYSGLGLAAMAMVAVVTVWSVVRLPSTRS
jgi:MFS family permease